MIESLESVITKKLEQEVNHQLGVDLTATTVIDTPYDRARRIQRLRRSIDRIESSDDTLYCGVAVVVGLLCGYSVARKLLG